MSTKLKFDEIECPACGKIARADFVDIGVGMQQSGPFCCEACGWCEEQIKFGEPLDDPEFVP
jgi:hypothetical protein